MIASTHLAAGAAVGALSYRFLFRSDPVYGLVGALILGVVSHLALDGIPHSEEEIYKPDGSGQYQFIILSVELALSFLAIYLCGAFDPFWSMPNQYLLAGMIGAGLPDAPHIIMQALKVDWKFLKVADQFNAYFHTSLHPASFWQGFIPQIAILAISLSVLLLLKLEVIRSTP
ncbi:MAG: hypothetical protein Q8R55_00500 [Candidatus Taylorbacteria bacterium]|nr:hypothetical protein [Candidatus Taylorbacteria bacterium]